MFKEKEIYFPTYHKINSMFKRNMNLQNKPFDLNNYSTPEFEYLKNNIWIGGEKIDGTNIRVLWNAEKKFINFGGRTERAQIPVHLCNKLFEIFTKDKFIEQEIPSCVLYGEGYGYKIQKGGEDYIKDDVNFILFDVRIDKWWLKSDSVENFANKLKILKAPDVFEGNLFEAVEFCKKGFESRLRKTPPEGIVLRPKVELKARNGERIITKLKLKDFL